MKIEDYLIKKRRQDNKIYKSTSNNNRLQLIQYVLTLSLFLLFLIRLVKRVLVSVKPLESLK